jgi:hypothetical protein
MVGGRGMNGFFNLGNSVTKFELHHELNILWRHDKYELVGITWCDSQQWGEAIRLNWPWGKEKSDCRKKTGSIPEVHLLPMATEEYAQRMQAIWNHNAKWQGIGRRIKIPSGSVRVCRHLPRRVTGFVAEWKMEFAIKSKPGTELLAIKPYHMSTPKL